MHGKDSSSIAESPASLTRLHAVTRVTSDTQSFSIYPFSALTIVAENTATKFHSKLSIAQVWTAKFHIGYHHADAIDDRIYKIVEELLNVKP